MAISEAQQNKDGNVPQGYKSVCFDGINYLTVGTEGRIDRIASDKTIISSNSHTDVCLSGVNSINGMSDWPYDKESEGPGVAESK